MHVVSSEVLQHSLSAEDAFASQREAFLALLRGQMLSPERARFDWPAVAARTLVMPVLSAREERLALKVVQVSDRGPVAGLLLLFDTRTGKPIAVMDAEPITVLRTAAASALSAQLLAPPDADTLAVFGAGAQAAAHVRFMLRVRPVRTVRIWARRRERAVALAAALAAELPVAASGTDEPAAALAGAQLVCCCTPAQAPLFEAAAVAEQAHVVAIGAFRPDMCELPPELFSGAFVSVDHLASAKVEAGDLLQAQAAGRLDWSAVVELGTLLQNPPARRPAGRTVFKSVGLAVQDYMLARTFLQHTGASEISRSAL